MPIVVTMDRRKSRRERGDAVVELTDRLNNDPDVQLALPFERTVGDELQGVLATPRALGAVVMAATQMGGWWIGVGFGTLDRLAASARESSGEAFVKARGAVERAKSRPWGAAVEGGGAWGRDVEAALALLIAVGQSRTEAGWTVVEQKWQTRATDEEIARRLGLSRQAVSLRLQRAFFQHEAEGRALLEHLASLTDAALVPEWTRSIA
jgi:hypothetical protein